MELIDPHIPLLRWDMATPIEACTEIVGMDIIMVIMVEVEWEWVEWE